MYFDIVINKDSFYIVEPVSKPKTHDSALETLKNIEFVVKNKSTYDPSHKDIYSDLSQYELFDLLKTKSSQIHKGYHKRLSKLNWLFRKIFSKEKEIGAVHTRIDNYIRPPQALPMPNELIQEAAKFLRVADLGILAQLNRHGRAHAETDMVRKARKLGYEGRNHTEATKYIDNLFKEVIDLAKQKIIPKKHLSYKETRKILTWKTLDSERVLQNLQNLSTEDLFTILSKEELYSPNFTKARKVFSIKENAKLTKTDSDIIKQKGNIGLFLAAKNGDKNICKLLLQHGANINARDQEGRTALALAVIEGKVEVVKFLIEQGADVNTVNVRGNTPLLHSTSATSAEITKLLLESGRLTTIDHLSNHANVGNALHYAAKQGNLAQVELLLQHGADINARDQEGRTALALAKQYGNKAVDTLLLLNGAVV